jgi:hypothetical protein
MSYVASVVTYADGQFGFCGIWGGWRPVSSRKWKHVIRFPMIHKIVLERPVCCSFHLISNPEDETNTFSPDCKCVTSFRARLMTAAYRMSRRDPKWGVGWNQNWYASCIQGKNLPSSRGILISASVNWHSQNKHEKT